MAVAAAESGNSEVARVAIAKADAVLAATPTISVARLARAQLDRIRALALVDAEVLPEARLTELRAAIDAVTGSRVLTRESKREALAFAARLAARAGNQDEARALASEYLSAIESLGISPGATALEMQRILLSAP